MGKLHSALPREITSPFPHAIYPNYTQKHVITYTHCVVVAFVVVVVVVVVINSITHDITYKLNHVINEDTSEIP